MMNVCKFVHSDTPASAIWLNGVMDASSGQAVTNGFLYASSHRESPVSILTSENVRSFNVSRLTLKLQVVALVSTQVRGDMQSL